MRHLTNGKLVKISRCEIDFTSSPHQWINGKTANVTLEWNGYLIGNLALSSGNELVAVSPSEITQAQFGERNVDDKYSVTLPWSFTMAAGTSAALLIPRASNTNAHPLYNYEFNSVVPDRNFTLNYPGQSFAETIHSQGSWYHAGPPETSGSWIIYTWQTWGAASIVMSPPDQSAVGLYAYYTGIGVIDVTTSYRYEGTFDPEGPSPLPEDSTVSTPCASSLRFITFINDDGSDDGSSCATLLTVNSVVGGGWTRESLNGVGSYTPNNPSQPSVTVT
jgi:hypothetical protein